VNEGERVDPVQLRHGNVEDDHVGPDLARLGNGFLTVTGFTDDLESAVGLEKHLEETAELGDIVDHEYADRHR
jgi:hypothetical protein